MMQRDQQLQQQFAATQAAPQAQQTAPAPAAPPPETTPSNVTDVTPPPAPDQPVTVNYFYNTLAPYGSWVIVGGYGRCWRPTACVYNSGWQPYCDNGHWVYSDCGWYWASSYAWGATFHYGRWFRDASVGWCWYPDTVWAPSWVTWRYSNNYCGWAPLPPRTTYQAGVGIVYNGGTVSVGFNFGLGANCFTFVPTPYFCNPHPRNYCVAPAQVTQVYNNTTVINNYNINNRTIVNHGIAVENIAAASRTPIRPVPVHQVNTGFNHGWQRQSFDRPGYGSDANHPVHSRDFGSPLRSPGSSQSYSPQPNQNGMAYQAAPPRTAGVPNQPSPQRHNEIAMAPQHPMPPADDHSHRSGAPVQASSASQNNFNPQSAPARINNTPNPAQSEHNPAAVTAPQHSAPVIYYHPQPQPAPGQSAPANYNASRPQPAPSQWQPTGTPRNESRNYGPPQNAYHPPAVPAPQPSVPANTSTPAQSQQGGNQHQSGGYQQSGSQQQGGSHYGNNGNQNWPGH
jgi:hypothetical protein